MTELASVFRIAPATLRLWARTGRIPCVRLSRRAVRFDPQQVLDSLAGPVHVSVAVRESFPELRLPGGAAGEGIR